MTIMLILNAVLALAVVAGLLSLLGWGIASDRARAAALPRQRSRRVRARSQAGQPARLEHRGYGRAPEMNV